ncbi:MAG: cyclic nucleotide-binding domain-containing protein, partial [bacterium]|nr:cyclic nucleotide-binding domain-containing protein [bacterium]
SKRMQAQFSDSDRACATLRENWECWRKDEQLKAPCLQELKKILETCAGLPEVRTKIEKQDVPISHPVDYYSHQLIVPLLQSMTEIALSIEGNTSTFANTYNIFLQWKERIGLERTIGARGLIKHDLHNREFLERILFLISEQKAYQNMYMAMASDSQKRVVKDALNSSTCTKLNQLHNLFQKAPKSETLSQLEPETWFDLITAKIEALHNVEKQLVETLKEHNNNGKAVPVTQSPLSSFGEYEPLVKSLQLFSALPEESLHSLLQHGQVREFPKGKLLFLEGEHANRLYVVLRGWIKIFNGTTSGEETILQMLSSGDPIMESAVFLNTTFPVSAQVAENSILLSLPAPVVREQVRGNHELTLNLLENMSHRSQGSIRQIESARLKSADERVGWFLLKLLIEQGYASKRIELPYDKSLIASYLDMKRETFSRSLKRLKEKGFAIENNTIIAPDFGTLCGFCDSSIKKKCTRQSTPDCENFQSDQINEAY